jgi:hypothetical protein
MLDSIKWIHFFLLYAFSVNVLGEKYKFWSCPCEVNWGVGVFETWLSPLLRSEWVAYADSARSIPICIYTCMEDQFSPPNCRELNANGFTRDRQDRDWLVVSGGGGGGVGGWARCGWVAKSLQLKFAFCIKLCD